MTPKPPRKSGRNCKEFLDVGKDIEQTFQSYNDNRMKTLHQLQNEKPSTIIDNFLLHENSRNSTDKNKTFDENDLVYIGFDMLIGGVATSSTFLYNILGILVNHPSIQDRAYREINEVIGQRLPMFEDRQKLPFIEALILETLRYTSLVPVAFRHSTAANFDFHGYFIPKGTMIFPNLWAANHDEKYWENPWEFNPLRFYEHGELVGPDHVKRKRLLSFGAGRRHCTGEAYARHWLFLFVTLMLQKFKFFPAEGQPVPQHDPRDYMVRLNLLIKPYSLSAHLRDT